MSTIPAPGTAINQKRTQSGAGYGQGSSDADRDMNSIYSSRENSYREDNIRASSNHAGIPSSDNFFHWHRPDAEKK